MLGFTFLPTQRVLVKLIKGENRDLIKSIVKSVCVEEAYRSYISLIDAALLKCVVTFTSVSNFFLSVEDSILVRHHVQSLSIGMLPSKDY